MGKSTISMAIMAIFHSYVNVYQRVDYGKEKKRKPRIATE